MVNEFVLLNIYNNIEELSDLDLQYKVWIKGAFPNYVSSYVELICSLYDSSDYEGFIENDIKEFDLKEEFVNKLIEIHTLLENYDDEGKTELEIINDPAWKAISAVAKETKALWEDSVLYELMYRPEENSN